MQRLAVPSLFAGARRNVRVGHRFFSARTRLADAPTTTASPATPPLPQAASDKPPTSLSRTLLTLTALTLLSATVGFVLSPVPTKMSSILADLSAMENDDREYATFYAAADPETRAVEDRLRALPLTRRMRSMLVDVDGVLEGGNEGSGRYVESRPSMMMPRELAAHNLTAGTLAGASKIVVPPVIWLDAGDFGKGGANGNKTQTNGDSNGATTEPSSPDHASRRLPNLTQAFYLGPALAGHPGIVHGGLLATLLDEGLARCCFPALPSGVGVTANLTIDYRAPAPAGAFAALHAHTVRVEGRKAWVEGWIETVPEEEDGKTKGEPIKLVEAKALFIEPRNAEKLSKLYKSSK